MLPCFCWRPPLAALQYEGFMSAGQRHLRLGAGWRYLCRANAAAVGERASRLTQHVTTAVLALKLVPPGPLSSL